MSNLIDTNSATDDEGEDISIVQEYLHSTSSSSTSSPSIINKNKIQLILPLDQGIILRWFILGSQYNSHALTPREIFMLNDFHSKNQVFLPDGKLLSGVEVYVSSIEFDYVFTKQNIDGNMATILIQIRSGWRHFYTFLCEEQNNFECNVICRYAINNPHWYYYLPGALIPTFCRILDKQNIIFATKYNEKNISMLNDGEIRIKKIFNLSIDDSKLANQQDNWKCSNSIIIDTNLNCWKHDNDASCVLPVDDLSNKTPNDSIFLNMVHILTKIAKRQSNKNVAMITNIPNLVNQVLRECYLENLKHTYEKLKNIRLNPSTSIDCSIQGLREKWHIIIDTNVLLNAAKEDFLFFDILDKNLHDSIVLVIPFVVYSELDHLKKSNRAGLNTGDMVVRKTINYVNIQLANNERHLFVVQTSQENSSIKIKSEKKLGTENDMRIVECARYRRDLGMKTMVVSNDTNLRTLSMSIQIQAFSFDKLSKMVMDPRYVNLIPERWSMYYKSLDTDVSY
eukprot:g4075.t1